jgi:hypothetical protein
MYRLALFGNTRKTGRVRTTATKGSLIWWWRGTAPFALLTLFLCGFVSFPGGLASAADLADDFFTNVHKLTNGGENAEA